MQDAIRVLIVDDDQEFRTNLKTLLNREQDLAAECVESGEAAVTELLKNPYDVVLLDMLMPGMNAHGTLREFYKHNLFPAVIVVTGHASVDDAVEMLNLGAHDYLLKPCATKEIVKKIHWAQEWRKLHAPGV